MRLRNLADVFAYAAAEGVTLRMDATEIRVRRPKAGRPGRSAFVSGKLKQNTIKTTVVADEHGAILWCGSIHPGGMHDVTAVRTGGIDAHPDVKVLVDTGYQGLAKDHPHQITATPLEPRPGAGTGRTYLAKCRPDVYEVVSEAATRQMAATLGLDELVPIAYPILIFTAGSIEVNAWAISAGCDVSVTT
jgi:hypothetical protein